MNKNADSKRKSLKKSKNKWAKPSSKPNPKDRSEKNRSHAPAPKALRNPKSPPPHSSGSPLLLQGRVDLHVDGFGFLITKDPLQANIYLPEETLRYVLHRDEVLVRVNPNEGERPRGQVVQILERRQKEVLAHLRLYKGGALIVPMDPRDRRHSFRVENLTPEQQQWKANSTVLARILSYPSAQQGTCVLTDRIEDPLKPSNDTLRMLLAAGWPREFSRAALSEAERAARNWKQRLLKTRRDIRTLPLVTIDGKDARDFDDAVCAKREAQGRLRLWVAIADVSFFVEAGTALDKEAFERSTSVYFPDHVVPMLPEVLSNGVCSLNPFEERACMVCEMLIDPSGRIESYQVYEGLMQSHKRLTYEEMQAYLDRDSLAVRELSTLRESLDALNEAYVRLLGAKKARGAIDLDLAEPYVILNREGLVTDIQTRARLDAHRLIEECMLAANECTARFLFERCPQGIYRVHETPDEKRIGELLALLDRLGVLGANKGRSKVTDLELESPRDFSKLLALLKKSFSDDPSVFKAVQNSILRTLKQARYSNERLGHFALALKDYTHFTSPIRRYPDLISHRLIKEALGSLQPQASLQDMESVARHCSDQERVAMDTERKLIDTKKCRFMEPRIGEEFDAWVSGVTEKGCFVTLSAHAVDGLMANPMLQRVGRFRFHPETLSYQGPGARGLTMGTSVRVKLIDVNVETRKIDFELLN